MNEFIIRLRDALREELDATNTYDRLIACIPPANKEGKVDSTMHQQNEEIKSIIEEIKQDEINHQGRLLALLLKLDPSQLDSFNKGLGQQD